MAGSPPGSNVAFDGTVIVAHPRRLVAETLCIALGSLGIDATLDRSVRADLALVDVDDPTTISALTDAGLSVASFGRSEPGPMGQASLAGARWHLGDDAAFTEVADAIARIAAGTVPPTAMPDRPREWKLLDELTPREREVLAHLVAGRRAADIAVVDFVSVTTVRNQIQSILIKLGAHSQIEAVATAVRAGWGPAEAA